MPVPTPAPFRALSSDGAALRWETWDGSAGEDLALRWQNEAWTAEGAVGRERVHYVLRLSPLFQVRQMLLFRDLDEPDLWVATDGAGRWGEVNGAHRTDLDGCGTLILPCTPFTHTPLVRRLALPVGDGAQVQVARVDVNTLGIVPVTVVYRRLDAATWSWQEQHGDTRPVTFTVDAYGLVIDEEGRYRRATS